ncbi:MAG: sulfur carrier protein ThiS adenylyltransferase ThiF [Desulfovibrio sp.]|nr:sulfur carrier protein ThiS adenylyltransferase ThiF [Desulfovibrio sp.]
MQDSTLYAGLSRYFDVQQLEKLRQTSVGFAGAGGLGSNAALMLARCGLGHFLLVDDDLVEPSNLNRQQYWPRHVGQPKVYALADVLRELNPAVDVETRHQRLTRQNLPQTLTYCPLWVEALDNAEDKSLFVEQALVAGCKVASASGLAGLSGPVMSRRVVGNLVLVGDFISDVRTAPPLAPRVTQAAALLAEAILQMILADADTQRI